MRRDRISYLGLISVLVALCLSSNLAAQINTVDLTVRVLDPQSATVPGAGVSVKSLSTGAEYHGVTDDGGRFVFVGLRPGHYRIIVATKGFATHLTSDIPLTLGQEDFRADLLIGAPGVETLTVTGAPQMIETVRTAVAETIAPRQIDNLPINGRNYVNFALITSQAQRDSAPAFGPCPTSGLNFLGQRARSNEVSVDGADAVDASVNGIRATVSQEAVQEFQLLVSNFMPEFGRASGGVINIVTKSGANNVHGKVFGYLRHKSLQARNPFSVEVDPSTGNIVAVKQEYTRAQAGLTLGGPIRKDKTFYFVSYETTRRQETGFSNIGADNFGLVTATTPVVPGVTLLLTPAQRDFVNNPTVLTAPGGAQAAATLFALAGSGSSVALNGLDPGLVAAARGVLVGPGPRFPIPIDCPSATPCNPNDLVSLPGSFVSLRSLIGNFPISEGTSFYSGRFDHHWNNRQQSFLRFNVSPSLVTGIQTNTHNQNFGQNAGSRTSMQQTRDLAFVGEHTIAISSRVYNETRFQFARRGLHYGYSPLPGGNQAAVNIAGFAFFGREPMSTLDRIERRYQWSDNLTWEVGKHMFKVGVDFNVLQVRSTKDVPFELNFGGVFNFGSMTASQLQLPSEVGGVPVPGIISPQAYGLGLPQVFIQGIGNYFDKFPDSYPIAAYIQDNWRIHPRLTLNYGLRYDVELTPRFDASTDLNRAAEAALNLFEGIPRDYNNVNPRFGLAWDPAGNGKTVVRAGYGIFYDHPPLGIGGNATGVDGALSAQLLAGPDKPTRTEVSKTIAAMNASSIFQGVLNQGQLQLGYLPAQQRFDAKYKDSLFVNQRFLSAGLPLPLLPFTLPVAGNLRYGYAHQANLSVEKEFGSNYKIGISYTFTHGLKMNRPRNVNATDPFLLSLNYRNAFAAGLPFPSPVTVAAPTSSIPATPGTCGVTVSGVPGTARGALGYLVGCPSAMSALEGQPLATAAFFNFFRPSGPNPSFAGLVGGYATQVALAKAAGYPTGVQGVQVPWSDVYQQESSGNSVYHGMTLTFSKRFAGHFEFLSSYTWSHAIDNSTDLQTILAAQDNRRPDLERSNSTFDQRHRWVTSAVFESPFKRTDSGLARKLMADFVIAPIVEFSSGRPFTVVTGTDFNLDFNSYTDRPSVGPSNVASPFIPGISFTSPNVCGQTAKAVSPPFGCTGNLGRNAFTRSGYANVDLRMSRAVPIREGWRLEIIADVFNLFNRFNVADVSPLCNPQDQASCRAGEPTASFDPRQFQFALKVIW